MIARKRPDIEILAGSSIMKTGGSCFDSPSNADVDHEKGVGGGAILFALPGRTRQ
jgi:hypothetical protein